MAFDGVPGRRQVLLGHAVEGELAVIENGRSIDGDDPFVRSRTAGSAQPAATRIADVRSKSPKVKGPVRLFPTAGVGGGGV